MTVLYEYGEISTPRRGRMQHRKPQKPTVFFRFGKPGHGLLFLSAGAWRIGEREEKSGKSCKYQKLFLSLQPKI